MFPPDRMFKGPFPRATAKDSRTPSLYQFNMDIKNDEFYITDEVRPKEVCLLQKKPRVYEKIRHHSLAG